MSFEKKAALRSYAQGLDFVYVNPLVVVCRAPQNEAEAERLATHFKTHHAHNHKVVNCSTKSSPLLSVRYFDDAEDYVGPVTMKQLIYFTTRADAYISVNPRAVLVLVCESGCEKSCVFAAAFLLHNGAVLSTEDAVALVNKERSPEAKQALCSPSLARYVAYYESLLREDQESFRTNTYQLSRIRLRGGIPNLSKSLLKPGCKLLVSASTTRFVPLDSPDYGVGSLPSDTAATGNPEGREVFAEHLVFDQLQAEYAGDIGQAPFYDCPAAGSSSNSGSSSVAPSSPALSSAAMAATAGSSGAGAGAGASGTIDLDLSVHDVLLRGDCHLRVFSEEQLMMAFSFHTAFVSNGYMQLDKEALDVACRDTAHKLLPARCMLEVFLTPTDDRPGLSVNQDSADA